MNVAAIRSWEEKDCNRTKKQNSGPRRQRRRRKRSASSKTSTTTNITVQQQVRQVQHISETPSRTSNNSASTNRNQTPTGIQSNPSLLEIAVHISQHSNLAKYHSTGYRPALSSEKSSPSLAKHPDFGLGDSSPSPETGTLSSYITQGYCIVPDSQSLPGSSSYVPSSSTSISVRATHTARLNRSSISFLGESHTSRDFTSTNFDSSSILAIATANGSIKDFPEIDVAASQPPVEISSKAEFPASQRFVAESCPPSASAVSSRSGDHLIISVKQHNNNTYNGLQTLRETSRRRNISSELFGISEDCIDNSHPSQATTTDDSVLSLRDPNSQTAQPRSEPCKGNTDRASSTNLSKTILPPTLDSQEPPQPPSISDDEMSDTITNDAHVREGLQSLSTKEKLKRMREASAAKKGTSFGLSWRGSRSISEAFGPSAFFRFVAIGILRLDKEMTNSRILHRSSTEGTAAKPFERSSITVCEYGAAVVATTSWARVGFYSSTRSTASALSNCSYSAGSFGSGPKPATAVSCRSCHLSKQSWVWPAPAVTNPSYWITRGSRK